MGKNLTVAAEITLVLILFAGCAAVEPADALYTKGTEALKEKHAEEAIDSFKAFIKHYPQDARHPEVLFLTAEAYQRLQKWKTAYRLYELSLATLVDEKMRREAVKRMFEIASAFAEGRKEPSPLLPFLKLTSRQFGVEKLRSLCDRYSLYPEAQRAMLVVGRYYLQTGDYEEAQEWLDKVLVEKPDEETVASAIYFKGVAFMMSCKGVDYDISTLERARKFFIEYLHRAPTGAFRKSAIENINRIDEALAEREFGVARFYLREGKRKSAEIHLHYILKKYPNTEAAKKAKKSLEELNE